MQARMSTWWILVAALLFLSSGECSNSLWCYTCTLKDKCFHLDTSDYNSRTHCEADTTHCIMELSVSSVTGAVVQDRMCGGQVYMGKSQPLEDGCYVIARQEDSRVNTTRCYCSTDLCNTAATRTSSVVAALLLPLLALAWSTQAGL